MTRPLPCSASPPVIERDVKEKNRNIYMGNHEHGCVVVENCKGNSSMLKMLSVRKDIGGSAYSMGVIFGRIQEQSPATEKRVKSGFESYQGRIGSTTYPNSSRPTGK
jgi:hypothetical protein